MNKNQNDSGEGLSRSPNITNGQAKRWDDPTYWKGVRIGQCVSCKRLGKDVLRDGLCWLCDSLRMSEEARLKYGTLSTKTS